MKSAAKKFLATFPNDLPEVAHTKSGIEYNPRLQHWRIRDQLSTSNFNFDLLPPQAEPLIFGLKYTLINLLGIRASNTIYREFHSFIALTRFIVSEKSDFINTISVVDIQNFMASSKTAYKYTQGCRMLLRKWCNLGVQGIDPNLNPLLAKIKIKRPPDMIAVSTLCPKKGPFTDLEFESIDQQTNESYADGKWNEADYFLVKLLMALGARPIQFAALKLVDFHTPESEGADYWLNMPIAKQTNTIARDKFMPCLLGRHLGEPLYLYVLSVWQQYKDILPDPWQAPLFPALEIKKDPDPKGFEFHFTNQDIITRIMALFDRLAVPSERLESAMKVSARRFRYTYGTRLAEEGHPVQVIARCLGHTQNSTAQVYIALTQRLMDKIDAATAYAMAPLAKAFMGRLISGEDEASQPNRSSRIIDFRVDQSGSGMGSCGQHGDCNFCKPIACYPCNRFEPWLDGPHEEALAFMLARREALIKTTDLRIASINDRAILACAEIILRCRELNRQHP
ncbi:MAG: site-specific integrase [Methylophilus sp.]|uniref:site-specific integrase n=1 Tax=Methylophilus sp. TaxID=29541 RepID=UPI003F9F2F51